MIARPSPRRAGCFVRPHAASTFPVRIGDFTIEGKIAADSRDALLEDAIRARLEAFGLGAGS